MFTFSLTWRQNRKNCKRPVHGAHVFLERLKLKSSLSWADGSEERFHKVWVFKLGQWEESNVYNGRWICPLQNNWPSTRHLGRAYGRKFCLGGWEFERTRLPWGCPGVALGLPRGNTEASNWSTHIETWCHFNSIIYFSFSINQHKQLTFWNGYLRKRSSWPQILIKGLTPL